MFDWYPHITLKLLNEKCLCINNVKLNKLPFAAFVFAFGVSRSPV